MRKAKDIYIVQRPEQRRAMASPVRLEILGHFINEEGMSIADIAQRMGRPPASLYYHFRLLEKTGLLERAGERPGPRKPEVLYRPVASRFALGITKGPDGGAAEAMKTVSTAMRMVERDMKAVLDGELGDVRAEGAHRNVYVTRLHCRTNKKVLAEINKHLSGLEKILAREARRRTVPKDADQYLSFTVALLPLRGRGSDG